MKYNRELFLIILLDTFFNYYVIIIKQKLCQLSSPSNKRDLLETKEGQDKEYYSKF